MIQEDFNKAVLECKELHKESTKDLFTCIENICKSTPKNADTECFDFLDNLKVTTVFTSNPKKIFISEKLQAHMNSYVTDPRATWQWMTPEEFLYYSANIHMSNDLDDFHIRPEKQTYQHLDKLSKSMYPENMPPDVLNDLWDAPYLSVDVKNNIVNGHEGRHRATILYFKQLEFGQRYLMPVRVENIYSSRDEPVPDLTSAKTLIRPESEKNFFINKQLFETWEHRKPVKPELQNFKTFEAYNTAMLDHIHKTSEFTRDIESVTKNVYELNKEFLDLQEKKRREFKSDLYVQIWDFIREHTAYNNSEDEQFMAMEENRYYDNKFHYGKEVINNAITDGIEINFDDKVITVLPYTEELVSFSTVKETLEKMPLTKDFTVVLGNEPKSIYSQWAKHPRDTEYGWTESEEKYFKEILNRPNNYVYNYHQTHPEDNEDDEL